MKKPIYAFVFVTVLCLSSEAYADAPDPNPGRFAKDIETFAVWDSKNSFPENAILFVGSSSVRFWPTATAFPGKPIINRGFGGSEISDVIHFYDQVIKPYAPTKIFLYAGDNDIGRGKMADQVLEDYKELVAMVRSDFPKVDLIYISIKPSKLRWDKWPQMVEANRMVREYAESHPNLGYADLATPLLDADGNPRDVFVDDGLHLNERGYFLWQQALAPHLD
jgi:lysophospholipase L1-like esterase